MDQQFCATVKRYIRYSNCPPDIQTGSS